jgi:hypothetical protein
VSFFKPKFVVLAVVGTLLPAIWTSGCTGGAFTGADNGAQAGASTTGGSNSVAGTSMGTSGSSVGGSNGTVACDGPEDCDDGHVCTTDRCNADGTCDSSPKCAGSDKCCSGDCAECCVNSDCDDGQDCTMNTCFSGQCMFVPDDTGCAPSDYCSANEGCMPRQACTGSPGESADVCDDKAGCTTDSCDGKFCQHRFCPDPNANLCCEGKGCAACCNDSQCDTDKDPCTVGSCTDGKCSVVPLCGADQQCCPSADGTSATCGKCCSVNDCDDKIGCTADQCASGQCSNTPKADGCDTGYLCDAHDGCVKAPACTKAADCVPPTCKSNGRCETGSCHFDDCAAGTHCCANGCLACCGIEECDDNIACTKDACGAMGCTHLPDSTQCPKGYSCNAKDGCVSVCTTDSDCQLRVITTAAIPIGTNPCNTSTCVKGQCKETTIDCGDFQTCCNGACALPNKCLETQ